ncbi:S-layer homology domain-containing protein [Meiothermus sp.]|uniref:S-layer homology domain-containing protein n=1 Tax=Meiothermus sp. TaxID=1955249 RepID=UPI0021DCFF8D|nr:S-layer homology domain-containing protein [Meiothermus sp.]GIW25892.1 MAG: S-layer protein [Meiothermus sp.]
MKKKLVVYLAGLLTVLGLGFGQAQFSDVPAGHWAKEAVERIAACGLITGFPDGTFRGNTNLTRYQAALIFQRLLNEIQQGGECVKGQGQGGGLSDEDLTAIRNAVQELAAELAALGVRVSALEDNAATKDDIARLEAAIEGLKTAQPQGGMDEAALADLADRVEAASVAADTALAQAQVLAERLDAVEGDVASLKTQVEADADSIRALNELAVLLNQDVLSLQDRVTALEKQLGDVDFDSFANKEDVSAIQEFATALRADLVRLSDRVSALDTRVSGLDQRLAAVEGTRPSLTGSITGRYGYNYTTGANYDVRRLYPNVWDDYNWDGNDNGQTVDDADFNNGGDNRARIITTFTVARTPGSTAGFNFQEARIQLRWTQDGAPRLEDALPTVGFTQNVTSGIPQVMVASVKGNIDGQPFTIAYNRFNGFRFTNYFMSNADPNYTGGLGRGFKVDFSASKAPFSPTYTVVFGGTGDSGFNVGGNSGGVRDYFGLRSTVNLLGLTAGVNYAEYNVREAATGRAGFALDLNGKLFGFLGLEAEYVATKPVTVADWDFSDSTKVDQASVIKLSTGFGPLSIEANARAIDPQFAESGYNANNAGLSIDFQTSRDNKRPYDDNERGFGVKGTLGLGFVTATVQYDHDADFFETAASIRNSLGVDATVPLFAGFSLFGYFYNVTDSGNTLQTGSDRFDSKYGFKLSHDGKASNALIKNLDLFGEYRQLETAAAGDYDRSDILVGAKYEAKFGPFGITPLFFFDSAGGSSSGSALKYGVQLKTDAFNLGFINPSLEGSFVNRTSDIGGASRGEIYWHAGLSFSNFFFNGGTLAVKYASYSGTGLDAAASTLGVEDHLYDHTTDYIYSDNTGAVNFTLTGLLLTYRYAGIGLDYHMGNLSSGGTDNRSYGFRISYSFSW